MNTRTYLIQTATLVAAAVLLAIVSNALAARERRMKLVGYYPNAQKVPAPAPEPAPVAQSELPVENQLPVTGSQLPVATTTSTVVPAPPATGNRQPATPSAAGNRQPSTPTTTSAVTKPAPPPPNPLAKFTPHDKLPYIEIPHADVKTLYDHGALFLDARRTSVFEQGHIAGSRPYSVWEADIDEKVAKLFNERQDPAQQALPIVVYCSGGDCEDSHMLAQKLFGALFSNVYVYKDGFPDWEKHGGAVHRGANP